MPTSLLDLFKGVDWEATLTGSAVICLVLLLFGSTLVLREQQSSQNQWFQELTASRQKEKQAKKIETSSNTKNAASSPIPPIPSAAPPVDVWADRLSKGVAPASLNRKQGAGEQKPFGSSYYYAHNNAKTTGGYKDGLRMEDYTMNGPRLLSRNGSAVTMDVTESEPAPTTMTTVALDEMHATNESMTTEDATNVVPEPQTPNRTVIPISKYLWDDAPSLGTIRIDQLPSVATGTDMVAWSHVDVLNHTSRLRDKGLLVTVYASGDVEYRLHIRTLFASVVEVTTSVAKGNKRLLVKLTKTKRQDWPHPHAKML